MQTDHPSQQPRYTLREIVDAVALHGGQAPAARALTMNRRSLQKALARAEREGVFPSEAPAFTVTDSPPDLDEPLETLWERRREAGRRVRALVEHGQQHTVQIHEAGPVGILHFGDPHLDDPGCDFEALDSDIELVRNTPGLFCGIIGDNQNNWVGRLSRLYARQDVTAADSWRLVEEMIRRLAPWLLYMTDGNHDCHHDDSDPLRWIMRYHTPALHRPHGIEIRFILPDGNQFSASMRHSWPGKSQYNPAFGQGKAAFQGIGSDFVVGGHYHQSGYFQYYNAHNRVLTHCLQLGAYKVIDDYATERGFPANNTSPSVLTILNPAAKSVHERVLVFQSARLGAQVLTALRAR